MTATMSTIGLRELYELLKDQSGRAHLEARYPHDMSWFVTHQEKGFENAFVQACLKAMWQQEMERDAGQSLYELCAARASR